MCKLQEFGLITVGMFLKIKNLILDHLGPLSGMSKDVNLSYPRHKLRCLTLNCSLRKKQYSKKCLLKILLQKLLSLSFFNT